MNLSGPQASSSSALSIQPLEQQMRALKALNRGLEDRVTSLSRELRISNQNLEVSAESMRHLLERVKVAESSVGRANFPSTFQIERELAVQRQLQEISANLFGKEAECSALRNQVAVLQAQISSFSNEHQQVVQLSQQQRAMLAAKEAQIVSMGADVHIMTSNIDTLRYQNFQLQQGQMHLESVRDVIAGKDREMAQLRNQMNETRDDFQREQQSKESEIRNLKIEISALKQNIENLENDLRSSKEALESQAQIGQENQRLLDEARVSIENKEQEISFLTSKVRELEETLQERESALQSAHSEISQLKANLFDLENQIASLRHELAFDNQFSMNDSSEAAAREVLLEEARLAVTQKEREIHDLKSSFEEIQKQHQQELQLAETTSSTALAAKEDEIGKLRARLAVIDQTVDSLKNNIYAAGGVNELSARYQNATQEIIHLRNRIAVLERERQPIDPSLMNQFNAMQNEMRRLQDENLRLKTQQVDINSLQENYTKILVETLRLNRENAELRRLR